MWKCKFMHCTDFLLLCMTTFAPQTIENLRMHKLTLPHENLKLKSMSKHARTNQIFNCFRMCSCRYLVHMVEKENKSISGTTQTNCKKQEGRKPVHNICNVQKSCNYKKSICFQILAVFQVQMLVIVSRWLILMAFTNMLVEKLVQCFWCLL